MDGMVSCQWSLNITIPTYAFLYYIETMEELHTRCNLFVKPLFQSACIFCPRSKVNLFVRYWYCTFIINYLVLHYLRMISKVVRLKFYPNCFFYYYFRKKQYGTIDTKSRVFFLKKNLKNHLN